MQLLLLTRETFGLQQNDIWNANMNMTYAIWIETKSRYIQKTKSSNFLIFSYYFIFFDFYRFSFCGHYLVVCFSNLYLSLDFLPVVFYLYLLPYLKLFYDRVSSKVGCNYWAFTTASGRVLINQNYSLAHSQGSF